MVEGSLLLVLLFLALISSDLAFGTPSEAFKCRVNGTEKMSGLVWCLPPNYTLEKPPFVGKHGTL